MFRVRRGVSAQHPQKYNLDEKEIERVSAFTRTKLEDVKAQMEEAHKAAKQMGRGAEADETNEEAGSDDDGAWVECVAVSKLIHFIPMLNKLGGCSEDDDAMDEDTKPKDESQKDDLSQYNLDDYDKESTSIGEHVLK